MKQFNTETMTVRGLKVTKMYHLTSVTLAFESKTQKFYQLVLLTYC